MSSVIYLDNAATTKPSQNALKNAEFYNNEGFYNSSAVYSLGLRSKLALDTAKEKILSLIGKDFDIIFTSCGSESNNTAIFSFANRGNSITTLGEHPAVFTPFMELKNKGYDARFAKINNDATVNVENLLSLIDKNTVFVSVMHVNNETGGINDINYIAKECKKINPRLIFHADGVQAFGKIPYRLSSDIDLYSVSAHKINGLKGVGALLKNKRVKNLKPLIFGGGQEYGLRSGTENLFGIKVFEEVAIEKLSKIKENYEKMQILKDRVLLKIDKEIFTVISNSNCSPYVLSVSAKGLRGEVLLHKLEEDNIIVGTGSACSSKNRFSRVLRDAGYSDSVLDGVIRLSFNTDLTTNDIDIAVEKLNIHAKELKRTMLK